MPEDSKTQAEEISIRFKTTRPNGLLVATSFENSSDKLQISLEKGTAKIRIHIGDREKVSLYTLEIPFNEIPSNERSLIRARYRSLQRAADQPLFPHYYGIRRAGI